MEIFNIVNYKIIRKYFALIIFLVFGICCFTVYKMEKYNLYIYFTDALLLCIIYIFIYSAPKFVNKHKELKNCFDEEIYKQIYYDFDSKIYFFKNPNSIKIIYLTTWSIFCGIFICLGIYLNLIGIETAFLYLIALALNCGSYYYCILYVYFLRTLSNAEGITEFRHNLYVPSLSIGFQKLLANFYQNSYVFLIVALLYTVCIYLQLNFVETIIEGKNFLNLSIYMITFLLGIMTFIFISVTPYFFLKRILIKWKLSSICTLENEITKYNNKSWPMVEHLTNISVVLQSDKIKNEVDIYSIFLFLSTIAVNIINIISFFNK